MPQWKMMIAVVVVPGIANHRDDTNRMMRIMMRKMTMKMKMKGMEEMQEVGTRICGVGIVMKRTMTMKIMTKKMRMTMKTNGMEEVATGAQEAAMEKWNRTEEAGTEMLEASMMRKIMMMRTMMKKTTTKMIAGEEVIGNLAVAPAGDLAQ